MAKEPKKPPPETDPIQSERFRKLVRDLEGGGDLDPEEAAASLDRLTRSERLKRPLD